MTRSLAPPALAPLARVLAPRTSEAVRPGASRWSGAAS